MSLARSILVNTAWLSIGEIATNILVAIGGVLLARELGDVQYGQLGFATSFVALFTILPEFGLNLLFINEASRNRELERRYFQQLLGLKTALGFIFLVVVIIAAQLTDKPQEVKLLVYYLAGSLAASTMTTLLATMFRVREEMKYEAILRIISSVLSFSTVLAVVVWHLGYIRLVQTSLAANLVMLVVYATFIARRYIPVRPSFSWTEWKRLLLKAFPLGVSIIFISIYYHLDSVMLSFWKTDEVVGWYNADYKFILMALAFVGLYHAVLIPVLSRLLANQRETARNVVQKSAKLMFAVSIPLAVGLGVIAQPTLTSFFGDEFGPGAPALQILIWSVAIYSVSAIYGNTLIAAGKRTTYMWGVAFGALINIIANILLIPPFSAVGAAIATVLAELVVCLYMFINTRRHIFNAPFIGTAVRPLIASGVMLGLLWVLPKQPIILPIVVGIIAYGATLLLIRGVTSEEILMLRSAVSNQTPNPPADQPRL